MDKIRKFDGFVWIRSTVRPFADVCRNNLALFFDYNQLHSFAKYSDKKGRWKNSSITQIMNSVWNHHLVSIKNNFSLI